MGILEFKHGVYENIDEAWLNLFSEISRQAQNGYEADSRDGAVVGEILNCTTVIKDPTRCILKTPVRKLPMRYAIGELLWYLSGNPNLDAIKLYTNAWDRMSDNGKTVNSNYGHCIMKKYGFDQMEFVKNLLSIDPSSRQAVIHIKEPRNLLDNPTKDVNCTVYLQFFVREGKLYMITNMRSNDLWMGYPNDVLQFTAMQVRLAMELGLKLGTYTHNAGSLHMYERDYKRALENVDKNSTQSVDGTPAL